LPKERVQRGAFHLVRRFLVAGFVGGVLTAIFFPPTAWIIGFVLHGSQVRGPFGSAYYFLSMIFFRYVTPISFFVAGISAVVGHRGFGVLLGFVGTILFATFIALPGAIGVLTNVAVAVALISCGVVASGSSVGWPFRANCSLRRPQTENLHDFAHNRFTSGL